MADVAKSWRVRSGAITSRRRCMCRRQRLRLVNAPRNFFAVEEVSFARSADAWTQFAHTSKSHTRHDLISEPTTIEPVQTSQPASTGLARH